MKILWVVSTCNPTAGESDQVAKVVTDSGARCFPTRAFDGRRTLGGLTEAEVKRMWGKIDAENLAPNGLRAYGFVDDDIEPASFDVIIDHIDKEF